MKDEVLKLSEKTSSDTIPTITPPPPSPSPPPPPPPPSYPTIDSPSSHLLYMDANSLYGSAQKMLLPQKNYEWASSTEVTALNRILNTLLLQ